MNECSELTILTLFLQQIYFKYVLHVPNINVLAHPYVFRLIRKMPQARLYITV